VLFLFTSVSDFMSLNIYKNRIDIVIVYKKIERSWLFIKTQNHHSTVKVSSDVKGTNL